MVEIKTWEPGKTYRTLANATGRLELFPNDKGKPSLRYLQIAEVSMLRLRNLAGVMDYKSG